MSPVGINLYAIRSVLLTCSLDHIFDLEFLCIFKKFEEDVILEVVEYLPGCCCYIKEINKEHECHIIQKLVYDSSKQAMKKGFD